MKFNKKLKALGENLMTNFQLAIINYQLSIPSERRKLLYVPILQTLKFSVFVYQKIAIIINETTTYFRMLKIRNTERLKYSLYSIFSKGFNMLKNLFNRPIWLILLPVPLIWGWLMLADRLETRTHQAMYKQLNSVKQIWGGNLAQPMPSVRYKRFGSDVSTLSKGEIHATDIAVTLKVDYRKKGLVYYTGYHAEFIGKYTIKNPENENIYLSFIFPYPTRQGEGVLQNVKLLINGKEDIEDTEYQPNLALWTGLLEPSDTLNLTVQYDGRGLNQFVYGFEPNKQINRFTMKVDVHGAKNLDYPESTMPPTEFLQETEEGKTLVWELDKALTQLNIGVILPDKLNIEQQLFVMMYRAPAFFLLFFISLIAMIRLAKETLNFIPIAITSIAYFLFYPLFAYLVIYLGVIIAFIISFGSIGLLILNYMRILYGLKIAFAVFMAYIFYLGITTVASLLPTYTGLILTIEGVVLLGVIMQVLSKHKDLKIGELIKLPSTNQPTESQTQS
jgi:hypothetical protein